MSNFNIVCEEWDQNLHKTWSYKKQKRLILEILKMCPTAKSFVDLMSSKKLPNKISKIINLCNPSFDRKQYIEYLKHYIVKYSFVGKFILSSIIGYGAGLASWYGMEKWLDNPTSEYVYRRSHGDDISHPQVKKCSGDAINDFFNNKIKFNLSKHPHISSLGAATGAKIGVGGLTYKLIDKLDNDRI